MQEADEKQMFRQRIWDLMERTNVASFPRHVHGRIPNFVGARRAAKRLASTEEFARARVVKVNPDSPQRPVRELAMRAGKLVLVPTPRLRGQFYLLDPSIVDPEYASSISGFTRVGERVDVESAPNIDLVVVGSVAVSPSGFRGMGLALMFGVLLAGLLASLLFTPLVVSLLGRYTWWPKRMRSGGQ